MGLPSANLREIKEAVLEDEIPLEIAIQVCTSTPATILKLQNKGFIKDGFDADILILDPTFNIKYLFANGKLVKSS